VLQCVGGRESYTIAVRVELERGFECSGVIVHRHKGSEHFPLLGDDVICHGAVYVN
jgi:hypothetical protein